MEHVFDLLVTYRYWLLIPFSILEGPIVSVIAGVLVKLGYFTFVLAYIVLIIGDIISDIIHYYMGHWGNRIFLEKYVSKLSVLGKNIDAITHLWVVHPKKMMFLSKLAYGISGPLVVSSALAKMTLGRFLSYTIPISLFQHVLFLAIGYGLGYSYSFASEYITYGGMFIAVIAVILIAVYIYVGKKARHELEEMN